MSILIFFIILALLVLVHEFGHFIVAKKSGIRVDEFGLGFPPRLWSKKYGETVYSLNWIPFGGFVKIFGENPNEDSLHGAESERSFTRKKRHIQALVLVAGVAFNILFAWILISIGFMSGLPTSLDAGNKDRIKNVELVITEVFPGSPAEEAGLKSGDALLSLQSGLDSLEKDSMTLPRTQNFIASHGGKEIQMTFKRGKEIKKATAIPREKIIPEKAGLGIAMDFVGILSLPPHEALWEGGKLTIDLTKAITAGLYNFIAQAITGKADFSEITGPIGIAALVGDAQKLGFVYLLSFTAFISLNLAVLNCMPFPALDGGRLLFVLIEAMARKPIKPKIANMLNNAGFALLILLMFVVTYRDIIKIIH